MSDPRLTELIEGLLEDRLSESERGELAERLRESPAARAVYWEAIQQDAILQDLVRESAGRELAEMAFAGRADAQGGGPIDRAEIRRPTEDASMEGTRRRRTAGTAIVLAVVLAAAAGTGWTIFRRSPADEPPGDGSVEMRETAAALQALSGDVRRIAADGRATQAESGQRFAPGEALEVGEEGSAEVALADGSRIALSADAVLRFGPPDEPAQVLHLERGGAEVEAERRGPDRPLVFTTVQARLTVLGTRFRLYAGGVDSRIELEEGKVRFERLSDGRSVEVAAGQYAVAETDAAADSPLVARPLRTDWHLHQTLLRAGDRVLFAHHGSRFVAGGGSHLAIWDAESGRRLQELSRVERYTSLAFTATDEAIVGANEAGRAVFWPLGAAAANSVELPDGPGKIRRCVVSRDGRWIAQTTDVDAGRLPVFQLDEAGRASLRRTIGMKASSLTIGLVGDGPQIVAGAWDGTTVKWDANSGRELARDKFDRQLHRMEMTSDGRRLAGYGVRTGLLVADLETGERRELWPAGSVPVNELRFSRDESQLLAAMADGVVRSWSVADGEPRFVLATGDEQVQSLDVSSDGRWLAVAGDRGRVTVWRAAAAASRP